MRALILASMATLVLSGLPPAPLSPLPAQPAARASEDPDSICAPFLQGAGYRDEQYSANVRNRASGSPSARYGNAPPPPPPPPPPPSPPPPPNASAADQSVAVTGQRQQQPSLSSTSPITVVGGQEARQNGRSASQGAVRSAPSGPQSYPQPIPGVDANRERYAGEEVAAGPGGRRRAGLDLQRSTSTPAAIPTSAGCCTTARCRPRRRCGPRSCSTISATIIRGPRTGRARSASPPT